MAMLMKSVCFVLCFLLLSRFHCSNASSSFASGMDKQPCGMYNFFCPRTDQCFDRKLRCTGKVCLDDDGKELNCFRDDANPGKFIYTRKKSKMFSKGSGLVINHWFVEYRGFAYEFGKNYGVQELDMNDAVEYGFPYKYGPKGKAELIKERKRLTGSSSCSRDDILSFNDKWKRANKYNLLFNNCRDYVKKLLKLLESDCPHPERRKRQDEDIESLTAPKECYQDYNSSLIWKLSTFLSLLIALAIFYNISYCHL